ncbi:MAG: hypothetical protein KDJ75_08995 [Alphaproteobacteria bacterium]|nr:hypothetical protein [Alphaproteobacteria bacterium]
MNTKILPAGITSYDLWKTLAVVTMIIDHIGWSFFPDDLWWRAVGRYSFPIWFFLIGYARTRDLPLKLWIGAGVLIAANVALGLWVLPMNILVTVAVVRFILDPVMKLALKNRFYFWGVPVLMAVAAVPTGSLFEYGTSAVITAMFGYLVRHREELGNERLIFNFTIFALLAHIVLQQLSFGFLQEQFMVMIPGVGLVYLGLYYFKPITFEGLTRKIPRPGKALIQLCGRRTLEIYVVHLLIFRVAAFALGISGSVLFGWRWML